MLTKSQDLENFLGNVYEGVTQPLCTLSDCRYFGRDYLKMGTFLKWFPRVSFDEHVGPEPHEVQSAVAHPPPQLGHRAAGHHQGGRRGEYTCRWYHLDMSILCSVRSYLRCTFSWYVPKFPISSSCEQCQFSLLHKTVYLICKGCTVHCTTY